MLATVTERKQTLEVPGKPFEQNKTRPVPNFTTVDIKLTRGAVTENLQNTVRFSFYSTKHTSHPSPTVG